MKTNLSKITENMLHGFFKLFSVGFTTYAIANIAKTYIGIDLYIGYALALPFGLYYSFYWIGYYEKHNAIKPILISGFFMSLFYLSMTTGLKEGYDEKALDKLKNNVDYMEIKAQINRETFDEQKFREAESKYNNLVNKVQTLKTTKDSWIESRANELENIKWIDPIKKIKSDKYKGIVRDVIAYRNEHLDKKLPELKSVVDVAIIEYFKKLDTINDVSLLSELKAKKESLSFDTIKSKRDPLQKQINRYESNAKKEYSFDTQTIYIAIFILGLVVEILMNPLIFWRRFFLGKKSIDIVEKVKSDNILFSKTALMERLDTLGVVHKKGRNVGKVFGLYATLINIVVLYKEKEKIDFVRYSDITNQKIRDFRYLDVDAQSYIKKSFELLEGKKVNEITLKDIEEIIKTEKK